MDKPYLAVVTPLANGGTLTMPVNTTAHPEHPIFYPPGQKPPTDAHPEHPIYWPPVDAHPEHPIVIPPDSEPPAGTDPPTGPLGKIEWHTVWSEENGWMVVGVPTDPHPSPATPRRK